MGHRAAFLDRDGTINVDVDYLSRVEDVRLLPGAAEAVRRLGEAGLLRVIISNQSAVARGMITEETLEALNGEIARQLGEHDAGIDAVYCCPHLPDGAVAAYARECDCRKPKPGLFTRAARDLDIDIAASFCVGDSERDLIAAQAAGCGTLILIANERPDGTIADAVVPGLLEAVEWVLNGDRCHE